MKKIVTLLTIVTSSLALISCNSDNGGVSMSHPNDLFDYVVDLGTISDYDESKMMDFCKEKFFPSKSACTCVVTQVDGKNLIGRNTDIILSKNPIFKFELDINKYKAIGISYPLFEKHLSFNRVMRRGLNDYGKMIVPFIGTDYLNENGLYIETNMRNYEINHDITGTNPLSETDVYLMSFPAFATSRCRNVNEVVELAQSINLYNNIDPNKGINWNLAFTIADAEGNYGVLEFASNKVSYLPKQNGQANFYITEEFAKDAKYQGGESRFEVANQGLEDVKTLDDMLKHMEKTYYSLSNKPYGLRNLSYDMRSEFAGYLLVNDNGEFDPKHGTYENCTTEWIMNDDRSDEVYKLMEEENDKYYGKYYSEDGTWNLRKIRKHWKRLEFWMTMYSLAVDCNEKTMKIRFYEDANQQLEFKI